jgi:hypothetical protein
MTRNFFVALLILSSLSACSKKQEVIFEAKSISYRQGNSYMKSDMESECAQLSKELSSYLKDGWRVVTSSPKEVPVARNTGTCVGTEYIVEK